MTGGAVKGHETQKCIWRKTNMIRLNDCARSRRNFKPFQIYTVEKKAHIHLRRWVLTLLALHRFLLQILLASLVWTRHLPFSPSHWGGRRFFVCFAFLSDILDCLSPSLGAPAHASVCYERRWPKHSASCWPAWRDKLLGISVADCHRSMVSELLSASQVQPTSSRQESCSCFRVVLSPSQ